MKNQDLFNKTIDILVKAYQNDTLRHKECAACACGNIIATNMGLKIVGEQNCWIDENGEERYPSWFDAFYGHSYDPDKITPDALIEYESSGYTIPELVKIECAFEGRDILPSSEHHYDESGYQGLMRVVDALMEIHEATETECKEAKELFVKA